MTQKSRHVPLDRRDPSTVRAVILTRMSDPNAKDVSMETQVEACERFIAKMGWPKPRLGPFMDKSSGYYHVERPALNEVERLIAQRAIDVVVALNFERVARSKERRYAALFHARKYGAEYRFAELEPDGKLADTFESQLIAPILEAYGELNRQKLVENLARGKAKRVALGYPSGGRGGAPYGFRKSVEGDATKYWAEETSEAEVLRHMFKWLAEKAESRDPEGSSSGGTTWRPDTGHQEDVQRPFGLVLSGSA